MNRLLLIIALWVAGPGGLPALAGVEARGPHVSVADRGGATGAVRAMLYRCLPGIQRRGALWTQGLMPAPRDVAQRMLGKFKGSVWMHPPEAGAGDVMMIHLSEHDLCRVVAPAVPRTTLKPFVSGVFDAGGPAFRQQFFVAGEDGFRAQYQPVDTTAPVRIRVSAKRRGGIKDGYAIFTVLNRTGTE